MADRGVGIVSDVKFSQNEEASFPILCETCLGDNPYVRMVRAKADKECKICQRPCSSFRWQPGRNARYKQTIICQICARLKNVCQCCLFDLEFGLPVQVRDRFLQDRHKWTLPESRVGRDWATSSNAGLAEDYRREITGGAPHPILQHLARNAPYYERNRPRVCTFWEKGECTRGSSCPYRHDEDHHDPSLKDQNIRDRYLGVDDPVANKILNRHEKRRAEREAKADDEEHSAAQQHHHLSNEGSGGTAGITANSSSSAAGAQVLPGPLTSSSEVYAAVTYPYHPPPRHPPPLPPQRTL
eukprot:Lankesteria_metandrocarpae@DN4079_c0_g1_i1.p1